jgi:hypothetical protein
MSNGTGEPWVSVSRGRVKSSGTVEHLECIHLLAGDTIWRSRWADLAKMFAGDVGGVGCLGWQALLGRSDRLGSLSLGSGCGLKNMFVSAVRILAESLLKVATNLVALLLLCLWGLCESLEMLEMD